MDVSCYVRHPLASQEQRKKEWQEGREGEREREREGGRGRERNGRRKQGKFDHDKALYDKEKRLQESSKEACCATDPPPSMNQNYYWRGAL
mmetsp:Transcript_31062/g.52559  ORF Transcript_31062/g.52559 Transcript_31062/m.52559 type:complete len:91 (+) Transcript_31062:1156-1428(+)